MFIEKAEEARTSREHPLGERSYLSLPRCPCFSGLFGLRRTQKRFYLFSSNILVNSATVTE